MPRAGVLGLRTFLGCEVDNLPSENPHKGGERRSRSDRVNTLAFGFACV